MNRSAFEALNRRHCVEWARHFSQRDLLRQRGLPPGFGLCAALVELWWEEIRTGRERFDPTAMSTHDLVARQARHAYVTGSFDAERASDADRALLALKYGGAAPGPQSLERDLESLHGATLEESSAWTAGVPDASDQEGLRLLLLRYGAGGHRMAYVRSGESRYRCFDPNAGEAAFGGRAEFAGWFADYWRKAGYERRTPRAILYRFRTPAPAEIPARES